METTNEAIIEAGFDEDEVARVKALCSYLECTPDDLTRLKWNTYGLPTYNGPGGEYAIGTDDEADAACAEYIRDTAWAFNASFLASFTELPEEVFTAMQDKCESSNEAIVKCIERADGGMQGFVEEAISADGRGHFLSGYDGNENESGDFYIYRVN